jgi:hypothetical protein
MVLGSLNQTSSAEHCERSQRKERAFHGWFDGKAGLAGIVKTQPVRQSLESGETSPLTAAALPK